MIDDHWFDALNKRLTQSAPRRGVLSAVTALSITQHLGASAGAGKGGKQRGNGKGGGGNHGNKGNGKGNGNKKPKPDPWGCKNRFKHLRIKDPHCSEGTCKNYWPDDPCEEKYCEFICNQCDGDDPRDFCIDRDLGPDGSAQQDATCCAPGMSCCEGGCRNTDNDSNNCGPGCTVCNTGQVCRDGKCACPATCPHGQNCLNGSGEACGPDDTNCRCWCGPNFKYCPNINGGVCASPNAVC